MPGKMARSDPRAGVRVTRGADSSQHLASVLQEGRENGNIDAGLGFIWRISVYGIHFFLNCFFLNCFPPNNGGHNPCLMDRLWLASYRQ